MQLQVQIIILFSILSIVVIELFLYAHRSFRQMKTARVHNRLKQFSFNDIGDASTDILRKRILSTIPLLHRIFLRTPGIEKLEKLIVQADASYPLGFFVLLSLFLAVAGYLLCHLFLRHFALYPLVGISFGLIPVLYLLIKKRKRIQNFEKQLPDALELIARSLRAGHAFSSGMKLVTENFGNPLGTEFSATLEEINFGITIADALKNLARRVDCYELKYFVVSVLLQRESGGNLSEIIDSLARLVRDRFKFRDKVKVLAAEGKISAIILVLLPFILILVIQLANPQYLDVLFQDPLGRKMALVASILMVIGISVMYKMTKVKV